MVERPFKILCPGLARGSASLFSSTQKSARKFLHQIKREFEINAILRDAYQDVIWDKPKQDAPRWGLDGIVLRRQSNPKEGTVEAWGLIDGMPTGGHYGLLVYDDIVTIETVRNPEMVRKATESWEMSDNLGAGSVRKQHIGTRYTFGDTYGQILVTKIGTRELRKRKPMTRLAVVLAGSLLAIAMTFTIMIPIGQHASPGISVAKAEDNDNDHQLNPCAAPTEASPDILTGTASRWPACI
jgi:hypothetical protein